MELQSLQVLFNIFAQICSVLIYGEIFMHFCFQENLLVAAANRLKIFISLKVTVYIQDSRLRSEKALDV